jgi:hypothetical protein
MMQHVYHDDIGGAAFRERQALRVRHAIEPRRALNVGRDHVCEPALEVADAAADLDRQARTAGGRNAIVEIVVDQAQHGFALPDAAVIHELVGRLHHIAMDKDRCPRTICYQTRTRDPGRMQCPAR